MGDRFSFSTERIAPHGAGLCTVWRPMAAWTAIVWVLFVVLLVPLLSSALAHALLRGDEIVIGNLDLLAWFLRPAGFIYLMVAGSLSIMASVIRYAGLFRIITDDLLDTPVSLLQTLFEILPDLPALFRLCVTVVAGVLCFAAPLLGGMVAIHWAWLGAQDINYYLDVRPPEWYAALRAAAVWAAIWGAGALYVFARSIPMLPAYLDGHRPFAWRCAAPGSGRAAGRAGGLALRLVRGDLVRGASDRPRPALSRGRNDGGTDRRPDVGRTDSYADRALCGCEPCNRRDRLVCWVLLRSHRPDQILL
jgi:hypothetical protein